MPPGDTKLLLRSDETSSFHRDVYQIQVGQWVLLQTR